MCSDCAIREVDGNRQRLIIAIQDLQDRQLLKIEHFVIGLLPAVLRNPLGEVPLGIHQANTHQRGAKVGGFFQVIPSQHTQAARIDGQGFVNPEFH